MHWITNSTSQNLTRPLDKKFQAISVVLPSANTEPPAYPRASSEDAPKIGLFRTSVDSAGSILLHRQRRTVARKASAEGGNPLLQKLDLSKSHCRDAAWYAPRINRLVRADISPPPVEQRKKTTIRLADSSAEISVNVRTLLDSRVTLTPHAAEVITHRNESRNCSTFHIAKNGPVQSANQDQEEKGRVMHDSDRRTLNYSCGQGSTTFSAISFRHQNPVPPIMNRQRESQDFPHPDAVDRNDVCVRNLPSRIPESPTHTRRLADLSIHPHSPVKWPRQNSPLDSSVVPGTSPISEGKRERIILARREADLQNFHIFLQSKDAASGPQGYDNTFQKNIEERHPLEADRAEQKELLSLPPPSAPALLFLSQTIVKPESEGNVCPPIFAVQGKEHREALESGEDKLSFKKQAVQATNPIEEKGKAAKQHIAVLSQFIHTTQKKRRILDICRRFIFNLQKERGRRASRLLCAAHNEVAVLQAQVSEAEKKRAVDEDRTHRLRVASDEFQREAAQLIGTLQEQNKGFAQQLEKAVQINQHSSSEAATALEQHSLQMEGMRLRLEAAFLHVAENEQQKKSLELEVQHVREELLEATDFITLQEEAHKKTISEFERQIKAARENECALSIKKQDLEMRLDTLLQEKRNLKERSFYIETCPIFIRHAVQESTLPMPRELIRDDAVNAASVCETEKRTNSLPLGLSMVNSTEASGHEKEAKSGEGSDVDGAPLWKVWGRPLHFSTEVDPALVVMTTPSPDFADVLSIYEPLSFGQLPVHPSDDESAPLKAKIPPTIRTHSKKSWGVSHFSVAYQEIKDRQSKPGSRPHQPERGMSEEGEGDGGHQTFLSFAPRRPSKEKHSERERKHRDLLDSRHKFSETSARNLSKSISSSLSRSFIEEERLLQIVERLKADKAKLKRDLQQMKMDMRAKRDVLLIEIGKLSCIKEDFENFLRD